MTDDVKFFFDGPFYPEMTLKHFHAVQMWRSTYAMMMSKRRHRWSHKNKKNHSIPMKSTCYVPSFNFFLGAVSGIKWSKVIPFFPTWLPHHVTYDVIIVIKTFCMSSHTYGENFFSIQQAVTEKNTKVLSRQSNKQTNKQEDDVVQSTTLAKSMKQIWPQK